MTAPRIFAVFIQSIAVAALGAMAASFAWAAGPLDGKVFIADAGVKGKPADEKDDIITFANGTFHSSVCDKYGFNKGEYTAKVDGGVTTFESETKSDKEGSLKWKGTIKDGVIEGTFVHYRKPVWYRPNPEPIEHWFKGKPKS